MYTEKRYRSFRILFILAGNPLMGDGQSVAYRMYSIAIATIYYVCWVGEVIETFMHLDNPEEMLESARIAIPISACIWIDAFTRFRKHSIENLISLTESFVFEDCPERDASTGRLTTAGMIPWIQKLTILGTCLVLGPHSIYMFVRSTGTEKLGLRMWTPYDARPSPVHEITVIIQVLSTLVDVTIFTGFVGLYATLVAIACTQLEKLQEGLKNFGNEKELKPNTEQEKLKEHIRFHQSILSFMGALEDTLNILVLGHFLVIVGALCFGVISAVAIWGNAGDLLQIILVMCSITAQLGIYCWFGERLTNQNRSREYLDDLVNTSRTITVLEKLIFAQLDKKKIPPNVHYRIHYSSSLVRSQLKPISKPTRYFSKAEGVKQAVWESEWVGAPLQQQRDLAFVMAEANKQFVLTAGGFTSLSHHTLIMVANQVMSYTMFLVNVRDENDRA